MARPRIGGGQLEAEIWRSIQEELEGAGGGAHVHPVSEVTDLQDALDSKASAVHNHDADYAAIDHVHAGGAAAWGGITGTLSNQADLQTALDGKSGTGHNHDASYAAAVHNHDAAYEPKNANIQAHVIAAHAPSNAQKNSDITKAEIEAKLIGEINSHSHAGGGSGPVVKSGLVNLGAAATVNVTFTTPFASVPHVTHCSQFNGADTSTTIYIYNVTANGFTMKGVGNAAGNVAWIATNAGNA
jgi:hypothetical protein